jgi:hypothetical protein
VRYTIAPGSCPIAVTDSTEPIRPTIAGDSSGNVAFSPNSVSPGATVSRLVPSEFSSRSNLARLEVEVPTTATIAAIPIAIPSAERATRSGRARSP